MQDLLIDMLRSYGLKEIPGSKSNPQILEFFKELGYDGVTDDSTTAWCSAALSYYAKKNGYQYHTGLDARGWLKMPVLVLKPEIGDVVVFWRESADSWKGHVGLFISEDVNSIWVLGGNQQNQLSIAPYSRLHLLGYRKLKKAQ